MRRRGRHLGMVERRGDLDHVQLKRERRRMFTCESADAVVRFLSENYKVPSFYEDVPAAPENGWAEKAGKPRETVGDRPTPAWLQVVPGSLQILIHSLPVRAQIDTILTEQLIVEFYPKN